jgi:stress response protein YsnF
MEDIEEKMMSSVLVGIFDTQTAAEEAKSDLLAAGFSPTAISMTGGTAATAATPESSTAADTSHHEGAIARFFSNLFGGRDDDDPQRAAYAETYQEAFRRGSYGVAVTTANDAEMDEAENILNAAGAVDIDERSVQWRQEGWTGGSVTSASSLESGATRTLPEVEEALTVGKRTVVRGGVRVFTRVMEVPVEESIRLREEHVNVERVAVDRPATEADFAAVKEGAIEVREMAEEPVVSKTSRVVGEVEIGKTATEREETVRGTVRKTRVDVEDIPDNQKSSAA